MWQGGLAAGKPSVPWYQIHVRGIPGWRACRRPQARPPRFVQGNKGERSLGPATGEGRHATPHVSAASTFDADHHPDASTRHPHTPFAWGNASVVGRSCRRLAWAPKGRVVLRQDQMSAECDPGWHCTEACPPHERAAQGFRCWATWSINRTLTLPGHEEGAKEAFEGPGFRRHAQSGVVPWTERTRRF